MAQRKNPNIETKEPQVVDIIKHSKLPKDKKEILIREFEIRKEYSGPLPDPESIVIYNREIPNGGDRLMSTVENQQLHRHKLETEGVRRSFNQNAVGQVFGFIIAIVFGFIAWDLAKSGATVVASILGSIDLVALVAVFVLKIKNS